MEEIVKLIPLLLIALLADPAIILFVLLPPILFGGTFAFIEWASQSFAPSVFLDTLQMGMYIGTTALISEFVPLFLTGATLVVLRRYYQPASWQFGVLGVLLGSGYGLLHLYLSTGHASDIVLMVAVMSGVGAYLLDRFQKRRGTVPHPSQQLFLAPDTSGDLTTIAIHSDRLDLRSINLSLGDVIFETFTPEITRFMTVRAPMIPAESTQFIRETLDRMAHGQEIVLSIHEAYTGRFLGVCSIHGRTNALTPELGIWLREDAQGKGYGTEAIDALVLWASEHLVCNHFLYPVMEHNHSAHAVARANSGTPIHNRKEADYTGKEYNLVEYTIPLHQHDPAIRKAAIRLWITRGDTEVTLHSPHYRLERERDIRLEPKPRILMQAYTITGRRLTVQNNHIRQHPQAWIEAGLRIRELIDDPDQTLVFFNKDAALALAIAHIHMRVPELLSIELISTIALDPVDPVITNRHDPIASVTTIASIPNNYYVLIFAINGKYKHIYHFRSNGELLFEDIHTMEKTSNIAPTLALAAEASC
jgi:RimJ/RimL family protein N-acetyltransferase